MTKRINGVNPWLNGEVLYAADLNDTIIDTTAGHSHTGTDSMLTGQPTIQVIYTGTGLDLTGATSQNVEFTSISAAALTSANYLIIEITANASIYTSDSTSNASITLQLQTKPIAGAYADTMTTKTLLSGYQYRRGKEYTGTLSWIHTLTASEKSAGVQVKALTAGILSGGGGETCSFTNIQTRIISLR
jgi:hypothetical protein